MRILISAFACAPHRGSEPGVGWEWPKALAEISDHEIVVLTNATNRKVIEAEVASHPLHVGFRYVAVNNPFSHLGSPGHYLYYYLWQLAALFSLVRNSDWRRFDLIHHLTYGGIRTGSLLWLLPRPFLLGPVGGGESAPIRLYRSLGLKSVLKELLRTFSNAASRFDPLLVMMQIRAQRILVRTQETRRLLLFSGSRVRLSNDVGAGVMLTEPVLRKHDGKSFRLLFAGRLLYWKGLPFLNEALEQLEVDGIPLRMDIIGDGPMIENMRSKADSSALRNIDLRVRSRLPQAELFELYKQADVFVFPSLHDSGGTVVIEALSFGLPIICFDLGGPPLLAGDAGLIVAVRGAGLKEAGKRLADAVRTLRDDPERRRELSCAAFQRAQQLSWHNTVRSAFDGLVRLSPIADSSG